MVTIHGQQQEDFSADNLSTIGQKKVTITLHYHRYDEDYSGWNLWVWLDGKNGRMVEFTDDRPFGQRATFEMEDPSGITRVGFIIRKSTDENDWASKRFDDRFITEFDENGHAEVWLMQGTERIFHHEEEINISPEIVSAKLNTWHDISVTTNLAFDWEHDNIDVSLSGATIQDISVSKDHHSSDHAHQMTIKTKESLSLHEKYKVTISHFGDCDVSYGNIVRTEKFDENFAYDGPLGALFTKEKTVFRLWSPVAQKAILVLYTKEGAKKAEYEMASGSCGTWHYEESGNLDGTVYMYKVMIDRNWQEAVDPYARAVTVNGEKGVVVDLARTNPPLWELPAPPLDQLEDAVIYELHIRDATIDHNSGVIHKGKYLGLTEPATVTPDGVKTGLDYFSDLGITHIQLLPIYDYWTIDEKELETPQYNWGYDPKHFNAPEGSYSINPFEPSTRIMELKKMIQAIHSKGMRVIMDVVFNHVYDVPCSSFHLLMPGYFFRFKKDGVLSNGTGVGNDTASERRMMRKFIVDSLVYWAKEYKIDGFRFDLMGIHDIDTMNEARKALNEVDPSIIMLGEGWDLPTALPSHLKASQANADKMPGIAHFNDSIRDHLKGNNFSDHDSGFVNGRSGYNYSIKQGITAGMYLPYDNMEYRCPSQVVNYVEAHDNHTLWDKLLLTNSGASQEDLKSMHKLASSIILLSQGIPFLHAGQEFMRTKNGDHNSYRSPDHINKLDWNRKAEFEQEVRYVKGLISLRKSNDVFRMKTKEEILSRLHFFPTDEHLIAYQLKASRDKGQYEEYVVIHNAHHHPVKFHLPSNGLWHILANSHQAGTEPLSMINRNQIEVSRLSTFVLAKPFRLR
ncbi:type I pullulanase [Jeotgalibacillus campisalis]|uniref:pullulanase n=1 Tax=Jeotgalibacillus campisalis TaxID=220754 RepID=A0A0C2VWB3_9BACL|nr:type I pullulanase [Jeotgalibacillus campisalis]KIL48701.1 pullulanase [Jeotgalibacillus campisalis]